MNSSIDALSRYRFEQARQCIESAKLLMNAGDYKGAANRSYYAIFHAMRSVLALEEVEEQITNAEKFCEEVQGYLRLKLREKI